MKYLYLLLFLSIANLVTAQEGCTPDTDITVIWTPCSANQIETAISQNETIFSQEDVDRAKEIKKSCGQLIEEKLTEFENQAERLTQLRQEVRTVRDVKGMQQQIEEFENRKAEALQDLENQLQDQSQSGLFVVYLAEIDPYNDDANDLRQVAQQALELRAIEDLNGTIIERLTRVTNQQEVKDIVRAMTTGKVEVEAILLDEVHNGKQHYIYMAKTRVTPLSPGNNGRSELAPGTSYRTLVINPLLERDYEQLLLSQGVDASEIATIKEQVATWEQDINDANDSAKSSRQRIIAASERNIQNLDRKINELRTQYADRSSKIQQYAAQLNTPFDHNNLTRSADRILQQIQEELAVLKNNWRTIKSQELFVKSAFVSTDRDTKTALAKKAEELTEDLRQVHSTTTNRIETIEVEDLRVTAYSSTREVEFLRELRQIWIMPVGRRGGFDLYVFARFEVTREQAGGGDYGSAAPDDFVRISGGTFQMGNELDPNGEQVIHTVEISSFYLSPTEVTFKEYDCFCKATGKENPSDHSWGRDSRPVIDINWCEAIAYANWLSQQQGLQEVYTGDCPNVRIDWDANGYRLPTEAEWEYAASAGGTQRPWAAPLTKPEENSVGKYANVCDYYCDQPGSSAGGGPRRAGVNDGTRYTSVVARYLPNQYGLYDMSGNVWEWCHDWYDTNYYRRSDNDQNPKGPSGGQKKVVRGGSFEAAPVSATIYNRHRYFWNSRSRSLGFRLARNIN